MDINSYIVHRIPKSDGTLRVIHEPCPELKLRQKGVLRWLLARGISAGKYAHGFVRGRSTATNAAVHTNKKVILKADLKDFFGSTKSPVIKRILMREGISKDVADEIVEICTLDGVLPAGAPGSPFIANLVGKHMDYRIAGLAEKYDAAYTRYADDLCFSSDNPKLNHMLPALEHVVKRCGYTLNSKKTRIMRSGRRQTVTGLVVNAKVNIPRTLRKNTRAAVHNIKMAIVNGGEFDEQEFLQIKGMLAYFSDVRPDLAPCCRADIAEIERLLEMRNRIAA